MTALLFVSCALVAVWVGVWSARRYKWPQRLLVRLRWVPTVRAAGLGRRGLPTIHHGRLVGDQGVRYRLRPATGGSINDVAAVAEELAAALRVRRCEVVRLAPHKGELVVLWGSG